jgi:hypothetical protein
MKLSAHMCHTSRQQKLCSCLSVSAGHCIQRLLFTSPPAVAFFGYLLNVVTTLVTATGSAAKRAEAKRHKLEVG